MGGPLDGVRIIEMAGIGPGPFAAMMLADNGAEVIRVERPGAQHVAGDALLRSRKLLTLDLKNDADKATLLSLVRTADGLIEGFRPGTMERLGLGPDVMLNENPALVFGRMTGWGQQGPYAPFAGHDINYNALTGALHAIGPSERPIPALALIGDFGGGGMMLAFSLTAAILNARASGLGQVIDCAMCDGSGALMGAFYSLYALGEWHNRRGANFLDGGAHYYGTYETADGKFVSIGPIEPQFYKLLLERLGLSDDPDFLLQNDQKQWPKLKVRLEAIFREKTQEEWCRLMEYTDICFAPVLSMADAPNHPHAVQRGSFQVLEGVTQPSPAPRYSRTSLPPGRPSIKTTPANLGLVADAS